MASLGVALSSVRNRVEAVGETQRANRMKRLHLTPGAEIVTYLPLQMALYFNVLYSPLWIITCVFTLENKYELLATHYKFVTITVYIVMFLVEVARLYLGYEGNLREKVPELAGFWLLTLLQLPLTIYLLVNVNTIILPLERAVTILLLSFLLVELGFGLRALHLMVKAQAIKFHLSQFEHSDSQ